MNGGTIKDRLTKRQAFLADLPCGIVTFLRLCVCQAAAFDGISLHIKTKDPSQEPQGYFLPSFKAYKFRTPSACQLGSLIKVMVSQGAANDGKIYHINNRDRRLEPLANFLPPFQVKIFSYNPTENVILRKILTGQR